MKNDKAFTLIELLVVISIISILISILLPALSSARKSAQAILCGSNTRQILIACVLYGEDYNEFYPTQRHTHQGAAGTGPNPTIGYFNAWLSSVMLYTGETTLGNARAAWISTAIPEQVAKSVYDCPTNPRLYTTSAMPTNYVYNAELGYDYVSPIPGVGPLGRATLLPDAARIAVIVDAGIGFPLAAGTLTNWSVVMSNNSTTRGWAGKWHNGAYNVGFLDSHVERVEMPS
ncbi:MAG: prepilin-type N-terminal cleavage/methylation domain-containing protein, partial [Phycisphaeraceae bacterium]|nr:prepilin-type N-terminal cleavage/methylation domain-containing protein [Phycisphaeraceae bacterium]